jgi:hypothetical protein
MITLEAFLIKAYQRELKSLYRQLEICTEDWYSDMLIKKINYRVKRLVQLHAGTFV